MNKIWWKILAVVLVLFSIVAGFLFHVPAKPILNETIRNIHFHVPMWFSMIVMLTVSFIYSIRFLKSSNENDDLMAVEFANQRQTFGQPLARRQAIQWMIADSTTELHAARLMTYHAAWKADQGMNFHVEASQVKLYADEVYMRIVDRAIQIHGGLGLSRELPLELMFRDARSRLITEGSSEIQRIIIASEVLTGRSGVNRLAPD